MGSSNCKGSLANLFESTLQRGSRHLESATAVSPAIGVRFVVQAVACQSCKRRRLL